MGCNASKKKEEDYVSKGKPEKKPEVVTELKAAEPAAPAPAATAVEEEEEDDDNELGEEDFVEIDYSKLKGGRQSVAAENMSAETKKPEDIAKKPETDDAMIRIRAAMDVSFVFDALNEKE